MFNVSYCTVGQDFHSFLWNSLYKNQKQIETATNCLLLPDIFKMCLFFAV